MILFADSISIWKYDKFLFIYIFRCFCILNINYKKYCVVRINTVFCSSLWEVSDIYYILFMFIYHFQHSQGNDKTLTHIRIYVSYAFPTWLKYTKHNLCIMQLARFIWQRINSYFIYRNCASYLGGATSMRLLYIRRCNFYGRSSTS